MNTITILIVEDEFIVARDLQEHVERLGYRVGGRVNSGEKAIQYVRDNGADLVLMDIILKGKMTGVEAAAEIHSQFHIPVMYVTANADSGIFEQAKITEPFGFIVKPFDARQLHANIEMALYKHRMEAQLRRSEEKYRQVAENANESITVTQAGMFRYFNPKTMEITGYSRAGLASTPFSAFIHPDDQDVVMERHRKRLRGEPVPDVYAFRILHKDGHIKWVEIRAVVIEWDGKPATLTFLSDISVRKQAEEELTLYKTHLEELVDQRTTELQQEITERKRLESQLVQSQKMDAIGQLAGGIAHDFNTLLGIILGHGDIMRDDLSESDSLRENLDEIIEAGHRAKTLVRQLLDFARPSEDDRHQIRLASVVEDVVRMLQSSLPKSISIRQRIAAESTAVLANSTQITQVIMNVGLNAGHAIGEQAGNIEIALENVDMDAALADIQGVRPGAYVCLSISDTGCGMRHEVLEHIFDPFFTTKEVGKGSGLGLSIVHGIVTSHGGCITVASEPGTGSTFQIYLPTTDT